jgi:hypothetical protein
MKDKELEVMCCFCGLGLTFDKAIEITIRVDREEDEVQAVYAHAKCLDKVLHQSIPRGFDLE